MTYQKILSIIDGRLKAIHSIIFIRFWYSVIFYYRMLFRNQLLSENNKLSAYSHQGMFWIWSSYFKRWFFDKNLSWETRVNISFGTIGYVNIIIRIWSILHFCWVSRIAIVISIQSMTNISASGMNLKSECGVWVNLLCLNSKIGSLLKFL